MLGGASAVIWSDAKTAVQQIIGNTRQLEDCERRLGTREDTRELRAQLQRLRKDTLSLVQQTQRALQVRDDHVLVSA